MITIENYKVVGWEHAITGMRNPKNSWHLSDSDFYGTAMTHILDENGKPKEQFVQYDALNIGPNDHKLAMQLVKGGPVHAKFRRMIEVYVDITAPLYWWKEFDTYKVGTVANSCSTMHKIHAKEFELDDFSHEHLDDIWGYEPELRAWAPTIEFTTYTDQVSSYVLGPDDIMDLNIKMLNRCRDLYNKTEDKKYWWQMIQLLGSSYRQKRTIKLSYETLANIYEWRRDHKLGEDHWDVICDWIEELPYSEFITGKTGKTEIYEYSVNIAPETKMTGFVEVDEYSTNKEIKLAILEDLGKCTFKKVDVDKPCASCAIDFGEE